MPLLYSSFLGGGGGVASGGGGGGDITLVGQSTFTVAVGGSTEVKTLPGTLAENDVVLLQRCCNGNLDSPTYDLVSSGYSIEGIASAPGMGARLELKRLGASPDISVEIPQQVANRQVGIIQVWRGVDTSTAMDVPLVSSGFIGSGMPDAPSIEPVTNGCQVFAAGYLDDDIIAAIATPPSGYGDFVAVDTVSGTSNCTAMIASFLQGSAGAIDAAAFGGAGTDLNVAFAFALRPAA